MLVLITACALARPVPAQIQGVISRPPQYYSGTYCAFTGDIWTATPGAFLVSADIKINGEVVAWYAGGDFEWARTVTFDSTHFGDGTSITVMIEAIDSFGVYGSIAHPAAPAKNRALVLGNNTFPGGIGTTEMNDVASSLGGMNFTILSSDQSDKNAILARIPAYQVFFITTHSKPNIIEDCFGDGSGGVHAISRRP